MGNFNFHNKSIVLLIKAPVLGGAERQALGLAKYLYSHFNCKVHLVATHSKLASKEFDLFAKTCGIKTINYFGTPSLTIRKEFTVLNLKKVLRAFHYLYKIKKGIKTLKPDIIIPFLNTPSKIASLIWKSSGAKITFWHQLGLDSYIYDVLEKRAINRAPFIIANAENGLDVFKDHYNVSQEKLFVLPQYVSINKIVLDKNTLLKELNIEESTIVIGMIAHYREEKYQDLLIKAFSKVKTDKKTHLILLGNKDNDTYTLSKYANLKQVVKHSDLQSKVSVLSGLPVEKILNILDIGVLVSLTEGTPNVVMEYMLYGLPVIASNHKGCINLLGNNSFLINNEEKALTSKLEKLIESEELRIKEGEKNVELIKKYNIENYILSLEKIINKFF